MKKLGAMLSDALKSVTSKPVTDLYPREPSEVPERLRSFIVWNPALCTGCGLCAMDCPAQALDLTVIDKKAKRFTLEYHVDRCTFCAQCVQSCNQDAIHMSNDHWELASVDKNAFEIVFGEAPDDMERQPAQEID